MNKLPFLVCFIVGIVTAQAQSYLPYRLPIVGYRGNVIVSDTLSFAPADTLLPITAEARNNVDLGAALTTPQPTIVRKGLKGVVRFATSDKLPMQGWWRAKVGGQTKYDGELKVGNNALVITPKDVLLVSGLASQIGNLQAQVNALKNTSVDAGAYSTTIASLSAAIGGKVAQSEYSTYKQNVSLQNVTRDAAIASKVDSVTYRSQVQAQAGIDGGQNSQIAGKLSSSFSATQATRDGVQDTQIASKLPSSFSATQAATDQAQNDAIGLKANSADVYSKAQTYTQAQVNSLLADRPEDVEVATFAIAKTLVTTGIKKNFTVANNELFGGASTHTKYNGTSWNHSPALTQNN